MNPCATASVSPLTGEVAVADGVGDGVGSDEMMGADSDPSLKREFTGRVKKGFAWTSASSVLGQLMVVIRTTVLARLLSGEDFGVVAAALAAAGAIYVLTNVGVIASGAVYEEKDEEDLKSYLNTVWSIELLRGVTIAILLLVIAYPVTLFYNEARLLPVMLALALTPILNTAGNVGLMLFYRELRFSTLAWFGLATQVVGLVVTIGLALLLRNYWALVWGQVIAGVFNLIASYVISPYRPRFRIEPTHAKRALKFGANIFIITFAGFLISQADSALIGRMLGLEILGVYALAYMFCNFPRQTINGVMGSVLFPAFAALKRTADVAEIDRKVELFLALACVLLMMVTAPLLALAPEIVRIFLSEKWESAIVPLRILLVAGFFSGLLSMLSALFTGMDRTSIESRGKIIEALVFVALLYPLIQSFGIIGAAWAVVGVMVIALFSRSIMGRSVAPRALAALPIMAGKALVSSAVAVLSVDALLLWSARWAQSQEAAWEPLNTLLAAMAQGANVSWTQRWMSPRMPELTESWIHVLVGCPLVLLLALSVFWLICQPARAALAQGRALMRR